MTLNQIKYVYEVSRCENITMAANKLFITQPSLSQQIMNLEEELGVKLFVRNPRSVHLTPAGEEFVIYAKRILSDISNLIVNMDDYSQLRKGKIRIGMLSTFGCTNVINKLAIFKKENTQVETIVTVGQSKSLLEKLSVHELDVAFIIVSAKLPEIAGLKLTKLFDNETMVLLPQKHSLTEQRCIDFADLREEKIIMPKIDSSLYEPIYTAFIDAGFKPNIICEASNPELFIQMVSNEMGVAFASERVVSAYRHHPFLARPIGTPIPQSVYFAMLKDTYDIPAIQRFSDYIIDEYAL